MIVIADIGNNHFGDIEKFKDLVEAAYESGADYVKSVIYDSPYNVIGSMPFEFYRDCMIYIDKIFHIKKDAKHNGIELFFTLISNSELFINHSIDKLEMRSSDFYKMSASMSNAVLSNESPSRFIQKFDKEKNIISLTWDRIQYLELVNCHFENSYCLYAGPYCEDPDYFHLNELKKISNKYGISHHGIGYKDIIEVCKRPDMNVSMLEKHFTLKNNEEWNGQVFRDTVHGLNPKDFKNMVEEIKS